MKIFWPIFRRVQSIPGFAAMIWLEVIFKPFCSRRAAAIFVGLSPERTV